MKAPSEAFECRAFARWLNRQTALLFSKIPIGDSRLDGPEGKKLTSMGVRRGVPDFIIVHKHETPPRIMFIEMKRAKPASSAVSTCQEEWLSALSSLAFVAYGYQEAKSLVSMVYWKVGLKEREPTKPQVRRRRSSKGTVYSRARAAKQHLRAG